MIGKSFLGLVIALSSLGLGVAGGIWFVRFQADREHNRPVSVWLAKQDLVPGQVIRDPEAMFEQRQLTRSQAGFGPLGHRQQKSLVIRPVKAGEVMRFYHLRWINDLDEEIATGKRALALQVYGLPSDLKPGMWINIRQKPLLGQPAEARPLLAHVQVLEVLRRFSLVVVEADPELALALSLAREDKGRQLIFSPPPGK